MSESSKQRTTCATASTSRMVARNWLPSPSPFDAPRTSPAISTKVSRVGMICADLAIAESLSSRESGTATSPTFGSMVQNGEVAGCAAAVSVSALNSVDLPTLGNPTIPHLNPILHSNLRAQLAHCFEIVMRGLDPRIHRRVKPGDDEGSISRSLL